MLTNGINNVPVFSEIKDLKPTRKATPAMKGNELEDKIELTQNNKTEPPKISFIRVVFNRYPQEAIDQINETKELPKNVKVVDDLGSNSPRLALNFMDVTLGTHKLPAGYELRQNILGFTHLVREDSKAWYLKNK